MDSRASPAELETAEDAKSEGDVALDVTAMIVDEQLNRQHLRPTPREAAPASAASPQKLGYRPARLESAVPDEGKHSFTGSKHRGLMAVEAHELPCFQHLAALEKAVHSGEALAGNLPELPSSLRAKPQPQPQPAAEEGPVFWNEGAACDANAQILDPAATVQSARGLPRPRHMASGSMALRTTGGGLLAKAPYGRPQSSPRFFFGEEGWGMQAPAMPGARKHAAAQPLGHGCSALRGVPLSQCRRGPHASALWVSTESARLRSEAVKPFGCSAAIAFIQNGGPRAMEPLQRDPCDRELF